MACEFCVETTQHVTDLLEESIRLKRTNRVLRTVNHQLRGLITRMGNGADELFLALCEMPAVEHDSCQSD